MCFLVAIAEERRTERLWLCDWLLDKYCDFTIFALSLFLPVSIVSYTMIGNIDALIFIKNQVHVSRH